MSKFDSEERASIVSMMHDPKRARPQFIRNVDMDKVVDALLRLAMEVSVIRDRLDIHEALAEQHGIAADAVEAPDEPDDPDQADEPDEGKAS